MPSTGTISVERMKAVRSFPVPDRRTAILDSILDAIGQTPCIRLHTVPQMLGLKCEVVAKCEFLNPGGSVKDRIGRLMLLDAEANGTLKKGDTLVEPTSGNTGIGLAMAAAARGIKMIITMPMKMSAEKERVLNVLGAKVIRTPTAVAHDHPDSLISVAWRLQRENPETHHVLDQYGNPANPASHYYGTGEEILQQCGGKVDAVVISAGTGGTLTGIARRLKEALGDKVQVIAVDPIGSILADPSVIPPPTTYHVEGIGYDFVPDVCDRTVVDKWVKSEDHKSFEYARMLQRHEGMLVGGSSGSAMVGVVEACKDFGADKRVVVIFPDNIRNYISKFADDNWLREKEFKFIKESEATTRPTYDALVARVAELEKEVASLKGSQ
jgi:cystathionine beta-synthase